MLSFEETMAIGQAQYQDVIDRLTAAGWPTVFTQTGGMNAALEVMLDGGFSLLITDAFDSLAWARDEHEGWTVGLYAPANQYDGDCMVSAVVRTPASRRSKTSSASYCARRRHGQGLEPVKTAAPERHGLTARASAGAGRSAAGPQALRPRGPWCPRSTVRRRPADQTEPDR